MPIPSGPGWLVLTAFAAALFARVEGGRLPYFMLYLSLAALALAAWQAVAVNFLSVRRHLSTSRCFVGQEVVLRTEVRNLGPLPFPCVELRVGTPEGLSAGGPSASGAAGPPQATGAAFSLGPWRTFAFEERVVPGRRGLYRSDDVEVRIVDALGLHEQRRRFPLRAELLVYPRVVPLPRFAASEPRAHGQAQQKRRTPEDSDALLGIRDYVEGDGPTRIHWKVSARTGELKSKEFARPGAGDALVALDLDQRLLAGAGEDGVEEVGVATAAALCNHFLRLGRRAGLVVTGRRRDVVPASRGPEQLYRMLAVLATAGGGGEAFAPAVLRQARELPRGSTVALVTASTDANLVRLVTDLLARGHRPAVVCIDRGSFLAGEAAAAGPEFDLLLGSLRQLGARTLPLRRGDDLARALSAPAATTRLEADRGA